MARRSRVLALQAAGLWLAACSSNPSSGAAPAPVEDAAPAPLEDSGAPTDAASPPGPVASTGGKGGLACTSRADVGGRSICTTKVGSVELKILEPKLIHGKGHKILAERYELAIRRLDVAVVLKAEAPKEGPQ